MPKGVSKKNTSARRSNAMKLVWQRKSHLKKVAKGQQKTFATKAYHKQQSRAQTKRWKSETRRQVQSKAISSAWKDKKQEWSKQIRAGNTDEVRAKKSKTRRMLMKDPEYAQSAIIKLLSKKPMSVPEKQMKSILGLIELPYLFVGNGKLMIGRYCPDFVRVDAKAIIEVYGYHHTTEKIKAHDKVRLRYIRSQGYSVLVVWMEELKDIEKLVKKIKRFDDKALQNILRSSYTQAPSTRKVKV